MRTSKLADRFRSFFTKKKPAEEPEDFDPIEEKKADEASTKAAQVVDDDADD